MPDLRDLLFQWEDESIRIPQALKFYYLSKLQVITHSSKHDVQKGRKQSTDKLIYFLIYLFIFGCVGSSLLRTGFL